MAQVFHAAQTIHNFGGSTTPPIKVEGSRLTVTFEAESVPGDPDKAKPAEAFLKRFCEQFGGDDKLAKYKALRKAHEQANAWLADLLDRQAVNEKQNAEINDPVQFVAAKKEAQALAAEIVQAREAVEHFSGKAKVARESLHGSVKTVTYNIVQDLRRDMEARRTAILDKLAKHADPHLKELFAAHAVCLACTEETLRPLGYGVLKDAETT